MPYTWPWSGHFFSFITGKKVKQSHYRPDRPWGFQEFEAPRFQYNRHMKVVRLSDLSIGHLYPQKIYLVLISVTSWVNPRALVRPEGLCQWKIQMIQSGIEPATFRLVAPCLNQLRHRVPLCHRHKQIIIEIMYRTGDFKIQSSTNLDKRQDPKQLYATLNITRIPTSLQKMGTITPVSIPCIANCAP